MKDICKAVETLSLYYKNKEDDPTHAFASALGAISANLEMILYRAMQSEDKALQEYATEMVERFSQMK